MKKILLVCGILILGTASAAPIPGGEEFSSWSSFEGMFDQIYKDVRAEDRTEICERVLEWSEFLDKDGTLIFSLEDCEAFANTNVSDFLKKNEQSSTKVREKTDALQKRYEFEKKVWHYEHDLERMTALSSIWNDGDGGVENPEEDTKLTPKKRTSPVDLIMSWNEIDRILFGMEAKYPEFSTFIASEESIDVPWLETPENDSWLDQRAEKIQLYSILLKKYYTDAKKSISGGYEEQARMFEEELNVHSLIPGRATTGTFDSAFTGSPLPVSAGMNFNTVDSIPASPDIPEQESVLKQTPMGELEGAFSKFFRQQSAIELRDVLEGLSNLSRVDSFYKFFVTVPAETNQQFAENISHLLRVRAETRLQDGGLLELLPLQQFNTTLDVWISILNGWEKKVNKSFLTHDKK
jgi:hypothetical protein